MKRILFYLFSIALIALFSCEDRDVDVDALTDFSPGILSATPADGGKVVKGDFDISVYFVDGSISPLSEGTVSLYDAADNQLATATKSLSGTRDSIIVSGSSFSAASLEVGMYKLTISVSDTKNQVTEVTNTFEISNLPFAANNNEMYAAGEFNDWGATAMTLVADYTWKLYEVELAGQWKFKNTVDWSDVDWGDSDCNGVVEVATGGGANTNCGHVGLVNITFNDRTLAYSVEPAIEYETNVSSLYLLGTFNSFQGAEYEFNLTDNNTWVLDEVFLAANDQFKFAENADFSGVNFGDDDADGKAEQFGANIQMPSDVSDAYYSITFNDKSLAYDINFLRLPSIGIIGSATPTGWDSDTDLEDNGDGTFSIVVYLVEGELKFRSNDSWSVNWGGADFPVGVGTQDGPNIVIPEEGNYRITFNPETGEYSFAIVPLYESIGIIGSATPSGWDADTDLADNGEGVFTITLYLSEGEAKFRANDAWDTNWGSADFPEGTAVQDGANISIAIAGYYVITFTPETGEYSFVDAPTYETVGIIGSATPNGWDASTPMMQSEEDAHVWMLTVELVDGEAKFRANDAWDINWGSTDFPMGTAVQDGPNIPVTAGTYEIMVNDATGEYSFTLQ